MTPKLEGYSSVSFQSSQQIPRLTLGLLKGFVSAQKLHFGHFREARMLCRARHEGHRTSKTTDATLDCEKQVFTLILDCNKQTE